MSTVLGSDQDNALNQCRMYLIRKSNAYAMQVRLCLPKISESHWKRKLVNKLLRNKFVSGHSKSTVPITNIVLYHANYGGR